MAVDTVFFIPSIQAIFITGISLLEGRNLQQIKDKFEAVCSLPVNYQHNTLIHTYWYLELLQGINKCLSLLAFCQSLWLCLCAAHLPPTPQ